jgi:hypothetical protein
MSDLFVRIENVRARVPGWCTAEKAEALAALVVGYQPKTVLEIGVYGGSSFFPMAIAMQYIDNEGLVIGCDPWDVNVAISNYPEQANKDWWANQDLEAIYKDFMRRRAEWGLEGWTAIERCQSRFLRPPPNLGLLHVDGAHNDEAVKDVVRFSYSVLKGGFVVLDDLKWSGGGVTRAESRLLQLGFVKLYLLGEGAVYQKVS